jgi:outer membrane translocation and assembly module TamA
MSALAARAEVLLPYNLLGATGVSFLRDLRLQLVPWADAGRVWDGGSDAWIAAAGIGVQRYLGPFGSGAFLRLDAAFPTGPDRPEDVRFHLHFSRALF